MIECPHLHLFRGNCTDCLEDVTWPDVHTVGLREARTRVALARVRWRLAVHGSARGVW